MNLLAPVVIFSAVLLGGVLAIIGTHTKYGGLTWAGLVLMTLGYAFFVFAVGNVQLFYV